MIPEILKDKKMILGIGCTTIVLFFLSYLLIEETLIFSTAIAIIPLPVYDIQDKICKLRVAKNHCWSSRNINIYSSANLIVMCLIIAFCTFQISKGNILITGLVLFLYFVIELVLLFAT